jgi:pimeloyl-ACP methyl ester carboxylesterase
MRSRKVDVGDSVGLNVRCWPGAGTPYLLVHGLSSNARLWDEVAEVLADAGHPVYAVDLRSHGESDAPPDGYDTGTAAADVAAVARGLGLGPAIVAGQSWGGNVVVRLAARFPDLVRALALVDGGWIDLTSQFDSWPECAAALRPPDVGDMRPDGLRRMIRAGHPDWSEAAIEATAANLRVTEDGGLERRLSIPDHMTILRSMFQDPPWRDFPSVGVPVLLMPAVPTEPVAASRKRSAVEKAAGSLAQPRISEYVGGDHDLHAQQPRAVAADLLTLATEA